ncbi:helix-turn-helix domain-containing protein [Alphaproteobacteria bacterium KMM 3653]|uniref:Helix-turn-helix domain-containing protein n=1 Tax=Harenicola maris TaxID=2841044 RepID=A0AAP2G8K4_9RHOB|nr:helix-turn-helix domain-containing protein [Harenicola maris]
MSEKTNIAALSALAHPGRMAVFRLLARRMPDTVSAGEMTEALALKPSTLSVYLGILTRAGLIQQTRHGRSLRYGIDLALTGSLIEYLVNDCCRGRPELVAGLSSPSHQSGVESENRVFNVLFVCTGNSTRSVFAEAILNSEGGKRFRAFSAGTRPNAALKPLAEEVLRLNGHDASLYYPKSYDGFYEPSAPRMDFVFTVCDRAANEECPPLMGQPVTAHWGMADPSKTEGSDAERALAFKQCFATMERRLKAFSSLAFTSLSRISLQRELDYIGKMPEQAGSL